jgi:cellulose synthase/poly-beta-1,6-N-acetylglucosamine synthase-like glycosyltransferase
MPSASLRLATAACAAVALLAASLYGLLWGSRLGLLLVTVGYLGYEVLLTVALALAALLGVRAWKRTQDGAAHALASTDLPTVAVLIAAHNERLCILETLESLGTQSGVRFEVLVASDGSTDGMAGLLIERYGLGRVPGDLVAYAGAPGFPLRLLCLPKQGKGAALNAALWRTTADVLVTLDADTTLAPGALRAMGLAFIDARVEAASGFLHVRNAASGLLTGYQFTEYVKNFLWRIGLAHAGVNLQVSGAFGGLRASTLRRLGGFSTESLVEDYEVVFRLHQALLEAGQPYRVVTVPTAVAFTDGPAGLPGFVHQRTRWFTGFLQTLWEYRGMVASRRYGRLGLLMLPVKCVDAVFPFWGLTSLVILLGSLASGRTRLATWTLLLLGAKWVLDAGLFSAMLLWHRRSFPAASRLLAFRWQLVLGCTESLGFNWLRQLAVLRAYGWFARRFKAWEQTRWVPASSALGAVNDAEASPQAKTGS